MPRSWPRIPYGSETYSVTALRDWSCLYRGLQKRGKKRKEPVSEPLHEGRIVHEVAARYVEHCCRAGTPTDLSAIDGIARSVYWDAEGPEPHSLPAERWPAVAALARRWAESTIVDVEHTVAVEEMWAHPLTSLDPVPYFYTAADHVLLNGDLAIIRDYKTDRHVRTEAEVREDLQMRAYCWALAHQYPQAKRFRVEMAFVRAGVVIEVDYGPEVVAQAEDSIIEAVNRVRGYRKRGQFPALAGAYCQWCGFTAECPLLSKEPSQGPITKADQADADAQELTALEARRGVLRKRLSGWTSEAGPVTVGGLTWGYRTTQGRMIADTERFAQTVLTAGQDPWQWLRVDGRSLPRIVRTVPEVENLVEPSPARTEFTSWKGDGDDD